MGTQIAFLASGLGVFPADLARIDYVHIDGPFAAQDNYGDEYPVWHVTLCNDDSFDIDSHRFTSFEAAMKTAETIADKLNIELVSDAFPDSPPF